MLRRIFVDNLHEGRLTVGKAEAHHATVVLRLTHGDSVAVFDSAGRRGAATIVETDPEVVLEASELSTGDLTSTVVIASAVPKGERADWLVEKLSELGVNRWVPLRTARSVVHPEGASKFDRWRRIAIEAAKQSRRVGVMEINPLQPLEQAMKSLSGDFDMLYAHTAALTVDKGALASSQARSVGSPPRTTASSVGSSGDRRVVFIGPEGGWTDAEVDLFQQAHAVAMSLGKTTLRIETAAIVAATLSVLSTGQSF